MVTYSRHHNPGKSEVGHETSDERENCHFGGIKMQFRISVENEFLFPKISIFHFFSKSLFIIRRSPLRFSFFFSDFILKLIFSHENTDFKDKQAKKNSFAKTL